MVSGQEKEKNGEKGETVRDRKINTGIDKKEKQEKKKRLQNEKRDTERARKRKIHKEKDESINIETKRDSKIAEQTREEQ